MLLYGSRQTMRVQKLPFTHFFTEPVAFRGQSGNREDNIKKTRDFCFLPSTTSSNFLRVASAVSSHEFAYKETRGASQGGRPSAATALLSQSLLKQAKFITKVSEAGFLQYSRGLGHSCFRIKLQ